MAKILVVDDELSIREFLHELLHQKGHEVVSAIHTEMALEIIGRETFDLIILDIRMPGESGVTLLKRVRSSQNSVPILIYSGLITVEEEKEARKAGANEILQKGIAINALGERIDRILKAKERIFQKNPSLGAKRLLIVDDDKPIRDMLARYFHSKNFPTQEAKNGEEALERARAEEPAAVLLDMQMGKGMDGIATLQKLREMYPKLGVVMVTGEQDDALVRKAMELGAYGYILKPFDFLYLELVVFSKLIIAGN